MGPEMLRERRYIVRRSVAMDPRTAEAVEAEARAEGCSAAEVIRDCIDRRLPRLRDRRRKRRKPERRAA